MKEFIKRIVPLRNPFSVIRMEKYLKKSKTRFFNVELHMIDRYFCIQHSLLKVTFNLSHSTIDNFYLANSNNKTILLETLV